MLFVVVFLFVCLCFWGGFCLPGGELGPVDGERQPEEAVRALPG